MKQVLRVHVVSANKNRETILMTCKHVPKFRTLCADPTLVCGQGAVDIEAITDPTERQSIELQIREFGQTPKKVMP